MSGDATAREVDARLAMLQGPYGDRLTEEQLHGVRLGIEAVVEAAEALRAVRLGNGDEPCTVFTPHREGE